jgi:hypothetical protein
MKYILAALLLLFGCKCAAQNNKNNLVLNTNAILSFNLNSPEDLEQTRTIYNALTVSIKTRSKNAVVSAKLSFANAPAGANVNDLIGLQFASSNSNNYSLSSVNPVYLSFVNQTLFYQPKHSNNQFKTFNYNLLLKPVGFDVAPGNYNFTLLFTMSQP